ncbi:vWA domain-containing protein [Paenibacillus hexagrammi]|uniref:VWA domain-containing protein n=1 Tax=Paenibacillus hexagrammi TaxID=2908839 RepID=A0ABY3SN03_9BACL|nr:VWA domain-containing protein [Paenibacillus sp. YPD9-1]UJF35104.1 VWA domain-containing protein [Paenibacillus sp. YPD9-1]
MHFASLNALWFLSALPIIAGLYLLKRHYLDKEVPSQLLWKRALQQLEANRPWQRLQKQLLLWLQLLAALLMVGALMKPFVPAWDHAAAKPHVWFVLDASGSMQALTGVSTRMEQAKRQILSFAKEHAAYSTYSLLVIKDQPHIALQNQSDLKLLEEALSEVDPSYGHAAYMETLSLASALTRDEKNAEVRVYSDCEWTESAEGIVFSVPVTVEKLDTSNSAGNVSILQFGVNHSSEGDEEQAVAVYKNWGAEPVSFRAALYAETKAPVIQQVMLQAGEQQSMYWNHLSPASYYQLQIDSNDALEMDNIAYAFAEYRERRRALYVGKDNLFLEKALSLAKVDVIKSQRGADGTYSLPSGRDQDLIILNGVMDSEIAGNEWGKMIREEPVLSIPPADDTQGALNSASAEPPFQLTDHPVTRLLQWQDVHVSKIGHAVLNTSSTDLTWAKAIISTRNQPLLLAGEQMGVSRLLFAFSLEQSDLPLRAEFPILIQNAVSWLTNQAGGNLGRRTASEQLEMAISPESVKAEWQRVSSPEMHRPEGQRLSATDETRNAGQVTDASEILETRRSSSPSKSKNEQHAGVSAVTSDDRAMSDSEEVHPIGKTVNGLSSVQKVPAIPGLYKFVEYDRSGAVIQSRLLESILDPRESRIGTTVDLKLVTDSEHVGPAVGADSPSLLTSSDKESASNASMMTWITAFILALLLVEWEVYRRGY